MSKILIDELANATTERQIHQMLQPQPQSAVQKLVQMYTLFLQRISEQAEGDAKLGKKVLRELLLADQPMGAERMLDAFGEDTELEKTNDQALMEERVNRCVRCCMNLVVHNEDSLHRQTVS